MEKQAVRKNLGGLFYKLGMAGNNLMQGYKIQELELSDNCCLGMEKAVREAGKKWKADNCKYN